MYWTVGLYLDFYLINYNFINVSVLIPCSVHGTNRNIIIKYDTVWCFPNLQSRIFLTMREVTAQQDTLFLKLQFSTKLKWNTQPRLMHRIPAGMVSLDKQLAQINYSAKDRECTQRKLTNVIGCFGWRWKLAQCHSCIEFFCIW